MFCWKNASPFPLKIALNALKLVSNFKNEAPEPVIKIHLDAGSLEFL